MCVRGFRSAERACRRVTGYGRFGRVAFEPPDEFPLATTRLPLLYLRWLASNGQTVRSTMSLDYASNLEQNPEYDALLEKIADTDVVE